MNEEDLEVYGKYKAKLEDQSWERKQGPPRRQTDSGHGRDSDSCWRREKNAPPSDWPRHSGNLVLNTPWLSGNPAWGQNSVSKGGAAGGGYSQVLPMEKHQHALHRRFSCHCGCSQPARGVVDNSMHFEKPAGPPTPGRVTWRRTLDVWTVN
ncbi:MAG: hypothetical protein Ct9H90mP9_1700 [Pseudomonadota bacterium]|nr:MAG: hypothetical protein Ct9H90mP9_1700 [Pseudomonadota bacterium]